MPASTIRHSGEAGLAGRRDALRAAEPRLYPRDIAARLNVTEAEIVALDAATNAVRLRPDWISLLSNMHRAGEVLALTRNADAVHEKTGVYGELEGNGHVALFAGDAIDLRLFLDVWRFAWSIAPEEGRQEGQQEGRRGIQIFAADGSAVHKIYTTANTDLVAWTRLIEDHTAVDLPPPEIETSIADPVARADTDIDATGLIAAWDGLRDTHQFHGLLGRFGVTRTQALRLSGPSRARPVATGALRLMLERAAASGLPIMVFVGNAGCIQIHTGPVRELRETGPWFNVLDPGFNLHLRTTAIDTAWVVAKPTEDGVVTSLELFDSGGRAIATLFGKRKPGIPEDLSWRALAATLPGA